MATPLTDTDLTPEKLAEIERKYDAETAFRPTGPRIGLLIACGLAAMSLYHLYAVYALVPQLMHRATHLAFVLGLVFLLFGWRRSDTLTTAFYAPGGIPLWDYALAALGIGAALYLPLLPVAQVAQRVGNPSQMDVFMGSALLILVLEATRRAVGWTLPVISLLFMLFALNGPSMPGALINPGVSWTGLINHLYMTGEGIYGIAIGAMAKYVFLFILFGVLATRIGLGQLFIDVAMVLAGRYAGGPAKVAIFSSAFMGTISGSSIANTVTTGALTIPAMKKVGYSPRFAAAVEATSSTGGQITPPILGAAAFIMVEYLELPLRTILAAALFPALLHYFGIFIMVHLEAKRLGLRGLTPEEMPRLGPTLRNHLLALIPLGILVYMILAGWTPDYAAAVGILACIAVGFLNPVNRLTPRDLFDAFAAGARNTLAVGAAAAAVGIVIGAITVTGVGFRLGAVIVQSAGDFGAVLGTVWPFSFFDVGQWTLFSMLVLIAIACIIMGAGIPTTATYIIVVTVAGGALAIYQIEPIVAHFFVFYYGVLADITPPVALAAYAAAGIAGSNPFQTGNTAFRLGIAKALVPFVFVYSPSLLLVTADFTWVSFAVTLTGAALGIAALGVAFSGFLVAPLPRWQQVYTGLVALLFVAPGLATMGIGLILLSPIALLQWRARPAPA